MQKARGSRALKTLGEAQEAVRRAWPQWHVRFDPLDDQSESFDLDRQIITLDLRHWPEGPAFAVRHAMTHLDWDHVRDAGPFTDEQCDAADDVAWLHTQEQVWVT